MTNRVNVFVILSTVLIYYCGFCKAQTFKIGAIFDSSQENRKAFQLAIQEINYRRFRGDFQVEGLMLDVPPNNPFMAMEATCELLSHGVVAVLGPSTEDNFHIVQSVCDDKDIPLLDVRWNDHPITDKINVYPDHYKLAQVYIDILQAWKFDDFVILYENNKSLNRIAELLKFFNNRKHNVIVRQLDKLQNGNYRPTLKEVWRSGATRFVLDCSIEILEDVLRQAQQIGLMTNKESYIITNLDFYTLDLTPYQFSETNITGIRFVNPDTEPIRNLASNIFQDEIGFVAAWKLQLETALIVDVVTMFGESLKGLPENFAPSLLDCNSDQVWTFGTTLINLVKGANYPGFTGYIHFDTVGSRSDFSVEIIELKEGGITKVGNWTNSLGLNISRVYPPAPPSDEGSLVNKTFVVITALTEPYGMRKESAVPLYGNDRYEGYGIDLIHELSQRLGFNYTFIIREDKKNGEYDEATKTWTGMIGDVINGKADLAITDLTITSERESAVDFTTTFMSLGISILYQKPKKAAPSFFSFADSFALDVWKLLSAAFFGVSIALFVLGRLSPSEWQNPYPCIEEPTFLVNQLSLRNCFWFMTGSLMQQGSEVAPIAISTRLVAGMWWFFTLIMVSSYTANLAASLSTESPDRPFNDVFELVKVADQKGIKYGAKINGSTANFFKDSKHIEAYQQIYQYMKEHEREVMVEDNKLGVIKAEQENYAFFMEMTSIEYEIQRRCTLTSVGGLLDEKGYGIAMRKNSSYRGVLSTTILKLQEDGVLADLKRKWWEEKRGGGQCPEENENTEGTPLNLKNVGGVFWVTIIGSLLSCVMVFLEMFLHTFKRSILTKQPFKMLLMEELKFYFRTAGMIKPVTYNHSERHSSKTMSESPQEIFDSGKKQYGYISRQAHLDKT